MEFSLKRLRQTGLRGPDVIVCRRFGLHALAAGLCRAASKRVCFYVFADEPPAKPSSWQRLLVRLADGVLADGDATARAYAAAPFHARHVERLPGLRATGGVAVNLSRPAGHARRIVFAGPMNVQSGAADLLSSVTAWAERHPGDMAELCWIGHGDFLGVLAAQPLPGNVSQSFLGPLDAPQMAGVFGTCGILAAPALEDDGQALVMEGLAAGLPTLGSVRSRAVRRTVTEGVTGWLFDPLKPGDMLAALERALGTSEGRLAVMRGQALAAASSGDGSPPALRRSPTAAAQATPGVAQGQAS